MEITSTGAVFKTNERTCPLPEGPRTGRERQNADQGREKIKRELVGRRIPNEASTVVIEEA